MEDNNTGLVDQIKGQEKQEKKEYAPPELKVATMYGRTKGALTGTFETPTIS